MVMEFWLSSGAVEQPVASVAPYPVEVKNLTLCSGQYLADGCRRHNSRAQLVPRHCYGQWLYEEWICSLALLPAIVECLQPHSIASPDWARHHAADQCWAPSCRVLSMWHFHLDRDRQRSQVCCRRRACKHDCTASKKVEQFCPPSGPARLPNSDGVRCPLLDAAHR